MHSTFYVSKKLIYCKAINGVKEIAIRHPKWKQLENDQTIQPSGQYDYNTSYKFWDQSPSPQYQCCLQVSGTVSWHKLRCCYSANMLQHWLGERRPIYFCQVDHSRMSRNFSSDLLDLNNLCEILSQKS